MNKPLAIVQREVFNSMDCIVIRINGDICTAHIITKGNMGQSFYNQLLLLYQQGYSIHFY